MFLGANVATNVIAEGFDLTPAAVDLYRREGANLRRQLSTSSFSGSGSGSGALQQRRVDVVWEQPLTFFLVDPSAAVCEFQVHRSLEGWSPTSSAAAGQKKEGEVLGRCFYQISDLLSSPHLTATVNLPLQTTAASASATQKLEVSGSSDGAPRLKLFLQLWVLEPTPTAVGTSSGNPQAGS